MTLRYMRYLATGLVTLLLPFSALSVELNSRCFWRLVSAV
jgi:hypothetical protein